MEKVYALDFDGVICDSIHECYENSYLAFRQTHPELNIPGQPKNSWKITFYNFRGLVRPSKNFYFLWKLITASKEIPLNTAQFESEAIAFSDSSERFEKNFTDVRARILMLDQERFIAQNPLFPEVRELWPRLKNPLYLVTAKDPELARLILKANSLEVNGIFGKGSGPKSSTLLKLSSMHHLDISHIYFVDDNPEFVRETSSVGARVGLAKWGYGPYEGVFENNLESFSQVIDFFDNED
jgi:phosphoglycolate phosphatase-like HAD superfamily hydrolase